MPLKSTETIEEPHLNLTPMIDIVFLLIIFFMVGTQFAEMERQYDVQLPTVSSAQPLTNLPDEIVVNIADDGQVSIAGDQRNLKELEADLTAAQKAYADQAVVVRGEGTGPYQHIADVLAVCHRAQIRRISLAVRLKQKDSQ